jgi:hypothetical protein
MCDSNKEIVPPSDMPPSRHDAQASGSGKESGGTRDERVIEYLRQRLATVVAAGPQPRTEPPDISVIERSHFSMDLDDESGLEDWSGDEESENGGGTGPEAAYSNFLAVSREDDELDPAWIIDRYCSWQEEDLDDAMMDEGEGSEVNRLLSEEWRDRNAGREQEIGIGEGSGRGRHFGADENSKGR